MNRRARVALLVTGSVCAMVLGAGAPASAAGAKMTTYAAALSFDGSVSSVSASLTRLGSGVELQDYQTAQYFDRVAANPGKAERVKLTLDPATPTATTTCASGTFFQGGVSLYGETTNWANMQPGASTGGRLEIGCLFPDGTQHRFHWGNAKNADGSYVDGYAFKNCVNISRDAVQKNVYRVTAATTCEAQDEVVNTRGRQVGTPAPRSMPFTATLTVAGTPAVAP